MSVKVSIGKTVATSSCADFCVVMVDLVGKTVVTSGFGANLSVSSCPAISSVSILSPNVFVSGTSEYLEVVKSPSKSSSSCLMCDSVSNGFEVINSSRGKTWVRFSVTSSKSVDFSVTASLFLSETIESIAGLDVVILAPSSESFSFSSVSTRFSSVLDSESSFVDRLVTCSGFTSKIRSVEILIISGCSVSCCSDSGCNGALTTGLIVCFSSESISFSSVLSSAETGVSVGLISLIIASSSSSDWVTSSTTAGVSSSLEVDFSVAS